MAIFNKQTANNQVYTISTDKLSVDIATYGASVYAVRVATNNGWVDVALGYTSAQQQCEMGSYIGGTIGRHGNRIAKGQFTLNGVQYQLVCNNGPNHLHGGEYGHDKRQWQLGELTNSSIKLMLHDPEGTEGYVGTLDCTVKYSVVEDSLVIEYGAQSDKDTLYCPTNHTYFNLAGQGNGDILDHVLTIHANNYLPVDSTLIPTGIESVEGTPFDYRLPSTIGDNIGADNTQLSYGNGYDHCYCVDGGLVATLSCPRSSIVMNVYTDQCGLQLYTGGFISDNAKSCYGKNAGLALETQCYPNNINNGWGTSCILQAGKQYYSQSRYQFVAGK